MASIFSYNEVEGNNYGIYFKFAQRKSRTFVCDFEEAPTSRDFIGRLIELTKDQPQIAQLLHEFFGDPAYEEFIAIDCNPPIWAKASIRPISTVNQEYLHLSLNDNDLYVYTLEQLKDLERDARTIHSITIMDAEILDFSAFARIYSDLSQLRFINCAIHSLHDIPAFPSLMQFIITKSKIYGLQSQTFASRVFTMTFQACEFFSDRQEESILSYARSVEINASNVKRLDYVFPKLMAITKTIIIRDCDIRTLHHFPDCPEMDSITINNNKLLTSIWGIPEDCHVKKLFITANPNLRNLNGFPKGIELTELDLSENNLQKCQGLPALLPVITSLNISRNKSEMIAGLPNMPYLTKLTMDHMDGEVDLSYIDHLYMITTISANRTRLELNRNVPPWLFYRILTIQSNLDFINSSRTKDNHFKMASREALMQKKVPDNFAFIYWYCTANSLIAVETVIYNKNPVYVDWANQYIQNEEEPHLYTQLIALFNTLDLTDTVVIRLKATIESKYRGIDRIQIDENKSLMW